MVLSCRGWWNVKLLFLCYAILYTSYAVPSPEVDIASGRAEDSRSFSQKTSQRNFFVKKKKTYHAAAGESGFHLVKRPG
jgi:hypothetical protein